MTLLAIIGVTSVTIIAGVVVFQFVQQQTDRQETNIQNLKEEYDTLYDQYIDGLIQECTLAGDPQSAEYDTCRAPIYERYGLNDPKYDPVR